MCSIKLRSGSWETTFPLDSLSFGFSLLAEVTKLTSSSRPPSPTPSEPSSEASPCCLGNKDLIAIRFEAIATRILRSTCENADKALCQTPLAIHPKNVCRSCTSGILRHSPKKKQRPWAVRAVGGAKTGLPQCGSDRCNIKVWLL